MKNRYTEHEIATARRDCDMMLGSEWSDIMLGILPGGEAVYIDRRDVDIDSGSKAGITMLHIDAAIHYNGPNAEKLHAMIRLIINNCNGIDGP